MKRTALTLIATTIILIVLISILFIMKTAQAANGDYTIDYVNHRTKILYNGFLLMNDTIKISGQASGSFLMGFPYRYGQDILQSIAYNESDIFPVTLNVPLENRVGFYGLKIEFPRGTPQEFNVGFILSNNLIAQSPQNTSFFILDFPAYPSFTKPAGFCNGSIILQGATYVNGTVANFTYQMSNLPAFTYEPGNVIFETTTSDALQLMDVNGLKREIMVDEVGNIVGSDRYDATNEGQNKPAGIEVILPPNASNPTAHDQFGRTLVGSFFVDRKTGRYKVFFSLPLETNESTTFSVQYSLPSRIYINAQGGTNLFNLTSLQFLNLSYYVKCASLAFVLPEGARILTYGNYGILRSAFQESVTIDLEDISPFEDAVVLENTLQIAYDYNPLWVAFRPTLWMWVLAIVGCSVFIFWKRPKTPERISAMPRVVAAKLRPADIKSFTTAYEEKRKIALDLETLENKVQKGRIPRRRYKVQRKTLETRLNSLSRIISETGEKMRAAGGQYAESVRQLESAEAEINERDTGIKNIESRHSRGELPLEAYRKLLADYERSKEKANTTVDGILLRLREESR